MDQDRPAPISSQGRIALWFMVAASGFLAWMFAILAVVLGEPWFVLVAPAVACLYVSLSSYRQLRRLPGDDDHP